MPSQSRRALPVTGDPGTVAPWQPVQGPGAETWNTGAKHGVKCVLNKLEHF